jgi:hypothetical protein
VGVVLSLAHPLQHAPPVDLGQHQIEDDQIELLAIQGGQGQLAVGRQLQGVAGALEACAQRPLQAARILDQQQLHGLDLSAAT